MTTSSESKKMLEKQDKKYIAERWKNEFSLNELKKYQEILDLFEVETYNLLSQ